MGEACPLPGTGTFQTRFSAKLHFTGAFESFTVPSPKTPRQAGQSSAKEVGIEPTRAKNKPTRKIKILILSSWGSGTHLRVLTHTPLEKRIYKAPESFLPLGKLNRNLGSDFQSAGSPGLALDDHLSGYALLEQLDM